MPISLKQGDKEDQAAYYLQQFSVILILFPFFAFSVWLNIGLGLLLTLYFRQVEP